MADTAEEKTILNRHIKAIQRHVQILGEALRSERDRRKQIQPAAVAYQTLRQRVIALIRQSEQGSYISAFDLKPMLKDLPKTLDG